jgi:hypothetical protein
MTSAAVSDLAAHGVSVWLTTFRERLSTATSPTSSSTRVVGVMTNRRSSSALSAGHAYDDQVASWPGRARA